MSASATQTRHRLRLAAGVLLGCCILAGIGASRLAWNDAADWADTITHSAQQAGPVGWLLFALAQALVAMLGIIPASLLGIAAGLVYGVWIGFVLAAIGTLLGGWIAFGLARSLLRPWVERLINARSSGRLPGLDEAVRRDGWRMACLLRISPVMPFALTSYALGLTRISGRDYLLGTLAALPALGGYVGAGALARHGMLRRADLAASGPLTWILLCAGVLATAALVFRSGAILARCGFIPGKPPA